MKVYKFGGASIKNANGIKNVVKILKKFGTDDVLIIVSATGKTTNSLEKVVKDYIEKSDNLKKSLAKVLMDHIEITRALFGDNSKSFSKIIIDLIKKLENFLITNKSENYNFIYDQVVSFGELISSNLINQYLNFTGIECELLDARTCIKTDSYYRDANLNWEFTQKKVINSIKPKKLYVTQGFIGSDNNNFTTTLGREGSDYSAAIFGYILNVNEVTIWKDVNGVLNADPRYFKKTELLDNISYTEAIELAFYGASVIHPKTLQPLQRKEIPLRVRSFINLNKKGTIVSKGDNLIKNIPCYIIKKNQILLSLSALDFSFIVEENISFIFSELHKYQMRVELIQNSAISFSVCINDKYNRLEDLLISLKSKFKIKVFNEVTLYTIRNFDLNSLNSLNEKTSKILIEQRTKETLQVVLEK